MFEQMKQMKELAGMLGNLGDLKEKAERLRAEVEQMTVDGSAGAGAVTVTMKGNFEVASVKIDKAMVQVIAGGESTEADQAMIEELIAAAMNDAVAKVQALLQEHMGQMFGGQMPFNLPGM